MAQERFLKIAASYLKEIDELMEALENSPKASEHPMRAEHMAKEEIFPKFGPTMENINKFINEASPEELDKAREIRGSCKFKEGSLCYLLAARFAAIDISPMQKSKELYAARALECFKAAFADTKAPEAIFNIGIIEKNQRNYEAALQAFRELEKLDPEGEQGIEATKRIQELEREIEQRKNSGSCVIATACMGDSSRQVATLRKIRDDGISADPIVRDFFHIFWSRYYEWSPIVARIASQDRAVAEHLRWSFLDPWFAWMEIVTLVGQRDISALNLEEQQDLLNRLGARLSAWLKELPCMMEEKSPADSAQVFDAFERFRVLAKKHGLAS